MYSPRIRPRDTHSKIPNLISSLHNFHLGNITIIFKEKKKDSFIENNVCKHSHRATGLIFLMFSIWRVLLLKVLTVPTGKITRSGTGLRVRPRNPVGYDYSYYY